MDLKCSPTASLGIFEMSAELMGAGISPLPGPYIYLALCTCSYLRDETKQRLSHAFHLLFKVHDSLRLPLPKSSINDYQDDINALLAAMLPINTPYTESNCNSVKYHWPRHWGDTRVQLGTSANEKSLERKLSETQKKNYKLTNGHGDISVPS